MITGSSRIILDIRETTKWEIFFTIKCTNETENIKTNKFLIYSVWNVLNGWVE